MFWVDADKSQFHGASKCNFEPQHVPSGTLQHARSSETWMAGGLWSLKRSLRDVIRLLTRTCVTKWWAVNMNGAQELKARQNKGLVSALKGSGRRGQGHPPVMLRSANFCVQSRRNGHKLYTQGSSTINASVHTSGCEVPSVQSRKSRAYPPRSFDKLLKLPLGL